MCAPLSAERPRKKPSREVPAVIADARRSSQLTTPKRCNFCNRRTPAPQPGWSEPRRTSWSRPAARQDAFTGFGGIWRGASERRPPQSVTHHARSARGGEVSSVEGIAFLAPAAFLRARRDALAPGSSVGSLILSLARELAACIPGLSGPLMHSLIRRTLEDCFAPKREAIVLRPENSDDPRPRVCVVAVLASARAVPAKGRPAVGAAVGSRNAPP